MAGTMTHAAGRLCPWWVAYTFDNPLRRLIHPAEATLAPYVRSGMHAADLGCGFGHFSLGMARLVGDSGVVLAMDVQQQMLAKTMKRARRQGLDRRIRPVLARPGDLGVGDGLDFVLAANMLHEVPDLEDFLRRVYCSVKSGGEFYVMEPRGHVKEQRFEDEVGLAHAVGFQETGRPVLLRERCVVFMKHEEGLRA